MFTFLLQMYKLKSTRFRFQILEVDDAGQYMWAYEADGGGYPLRCGGVASQAGDAYGPFVYDGECHVA